MIIPKIIQSRFDVTAKIYLKYCYFFEHCYNMNELQFAVGTN